MRHVSYPHVEHYKPKGIARFEDLMFAWDNWLLSCGVCNTEKGTVFNERDGEPLLLNPCRDQPNRHVEFRRKTIFALSDRGTETIERVGLDRYDLERERGSWLTSIDALLLLAVETQDPQTRNTIRDYLSWTMQDDAPYAAMTRTYLAEKCPSFVNRVTGHPHVNGAAIQDRIAELVVARQDRTTQLC